MKYNLKNIMKRAWQLVKGMAMTMSASLKQAWREAKAIKAAKEAAAAKKSCITLVKWFERKLEDKGVFLNTIIGIEKETEKAYLLKVEIDAYNGGVEEDTIWVPKSCTIIDK